MAFSVGVPSFGKIPPARTAYAVVMVDGTGAPPGATTLVVSSNRTPLMIPVAALGWTPNPDDSVQRTPIPGAPVRLVVRFNMPSGTLGALPKLTLKAGASLVETGPATATRDLPNQAKLSLLLDCSATMGTAFGGSTRLAQAKEALRVALELMANTDQAELIIFRDTPVVKVAMGSLLGLKLGGVRDKILAELGLTGAPSLNGNIEAAVRKATGTTKIVFTDCTQEAGNVGDLPADSKRYVLGVQTVRQDVFSALGQGLSISAAVAGDTMVNVQKFSSLVLLKALSIPLVLDPGGELEPGQIANFDFTASELDHDTKAIVFTDATRELEVTFRTGHANSDQGNGGGDLIKEPLASTYTQEHLILATLRLTPGLNQRTDGKFHVSVERKKGQQQQQQQQQQERLSFTLALAADSDLKMDAEVHSTSLEGETSLLLSATLDEAGIPVEGRASVRVELTDSDGRTSQHALEEDTDGRFRLRLDSLHAGDYVAHFFAKGKTLLGTPFLREDLCSPTLRRTRSA